MSPRRAVTWAAGALVALGALVGAGLSLARAVGEPKALAIPAPELRWTTIPKAPPGVMTAPLWGDPNGIHSDLHKFPRGYDSPLHIHSATVHHVVLSGTMSFIAEGQPVKPGGPGSYYFVPGGMKHTATCHGDTECIVFVTFHGPWDVKK